MNMSVYAKHFDREKALEIILYISQHLPNPTKHSVSKILYLADKCHLQEFGRLICGDKYIAMEYGPVPYAIYNMMKVPEGKETVDIDWDELILDAFSISSGRKIQPARSANTDLLAESEMECIDSTIKHYGDKTFGELTDITHDDAWKSVGDNQPIPLESIAETLPDAEGVIGYLKAE